MSKYIYLGSSEVLGRFGKVAKGDVLDLTAAEIAAVASDTNYAALPVASAPKRQVTTDVTLDDTDSGKQIRCNHAANMTVTLPETPTSGDSYEVTFGDAADPTKTVAVDPNGNLIESDLSEFAVASAAPIAAGTGYAIADALAFTGGTKSVQALLTVATEKAVSAVVSAAGSGYAVGDVVTLADSGGTETVKAKVSLATVKAVSGVVVAAGSGYAIGDVITLASGTGTAGKFNVTHAQAVGVAITAGGTLYSADDVLVIDLGTGTPCQIHVLTVDGITGAVLTASVAVAGDYTATPANPAGQASGSTGSGATFTISYGVKTVSVNTAGSYSVIPINPAAQGSVTPGAGTGATFTVAYGANSVTINTAGNYTVLPGGAMTQSSVTPSGGTAATFTVSWGVLSVTVGTAGNYSAKSTNPSAQDNAHSTTAGTGATFTLTWASAPYLLTAAVDRLGLYWDGVSWKKF